MKNSGNCSSFIIVMGLKTIFMLIVQTANPLLTYGCPKSCDCGASRIECRTVIPDAVPLNVRSVILHDVTLPDSMDFNDPGWTNVTYLAINPGSADKTPLGKQVSLHQYEFKNLKNLEYLQIACSCLRHVSINAFHGLDRLKVLDLSNNILTPDSFVNGLVGEKILPSLEELYLSNTDTSFGGVCEIDFDFLNAVRHKPLKVLDISRTNCAFRRKDMDLFYALSSLEKLNISRASVALMALVEAQQYFMLSFPHFPNLKSIDISYPPPGIEFALFKSSNPNELLHIPIDKKLREYHCRKAIPRPSEVYYLEQYHNEICSLFQMKDSQSMGICINTRFRLEIVDLAENSFLFFDSKILKHMASLKSLDISKNMFGDAISKEGYVKSVLANLYRLEVLIVSYNGIFSIPDDALTNGYKLRILDVSNNKLETIAFKTDNLVSLRRLDLSNNKISVLDGISLGRLNHLKLQTVNDTFGEQVKLKIDLSGNPISCLCKNRQYVTWVLSNNETGSCLLDGNERQIDELVLSHVDFLCKRTVFIVIYTGLGLIVAIITSLLACRIIKERRAVIRKKGVRLGIKEYKENRNDKRNPPVFLSFCCEDDEIVMTEIAPKLEEGLKKLLETDLKCVATGYNDFRPGFSLANEIIRCIEEACVVVFFVTNTFCKKMWCRNEALVAHYENKPIILMIWEDINLKQMPKYMYHHYQEHTRVHWVQENGIPVMKPDMDKLCEAIVSLFTEQGAL